MSFRGVCLFFGHSTCVLVRKVERFSVHDPRILGLVCSGRRYTKRKARDASECRSQPWYAALSKITPHRTMRTNPPPPRAPPPPIPVQLIIPPWGSDHSPRLDRCTRRPPCYWKHFCWMPWSLGQNPAPVSTAATAMLGSQGPSLREEAGRQEG